MKGRNNVIRFTIIIFINLWTFDNSVENIKRLLGIKYIFILKKSNFGKTATGEYADIDPR